jgi:hypothetical protein
MVPFMGSIAASSRTGRFRVHARMPTRLRALVSHAQAGWKRHAPIENMCLGGARLLVDERVDPGDGVTLSFTAPTLWDPLVLRARVIWIGGGDGGGDPPYTAGVAFEHSRADEVLALYELISTLGYE